MKHQLNGYGTMTRTRFGMNYEQGSILLVPFPFTDLSTVKRRPVLVVSKTSDNAKNSDLITCAITSNTIKKPYSISIDNSSLTEGELPIASRVLISKLFTIEKSLIIKAFAKLSDDVLDTVTEIFCELTSN